MKKLVICLLSAAFSIAVSVVASAQESPVPYITENEMTDVVQVLPPPPQDPSSGFDHDILRYMWGKQQRLDSLRLAMAVRDAVWNLDTTIAILSKPFGMKVSRQETPAIYKVLTRGVTTIENIRFRPKAHYFRIRPFAYFKEPSIFPQDDEWLATEGSYPSGHTIRAWACALLMSQINPASAEAVFARAWQSGESRVISGCHWQSDVDASRPVAGIGFSRLQSSAEFRRDMAMAQKEFNRSDMNTAPLKEVAGRKNFGAAHALMTTPQPCVMIATWDKDRTPDVMMAAWAGQYDHNRIVVSMSKHKTTDNLELTGAFTVSFADVHTVAESDYFGMVSGNKVPDKVARAGFTVTPSPNVDAPIINEYPLTLECKVVSWSDGILVGEVVNMSADEGILTDGKVDLAKLQPIVFDAPGMCYRSLGNIVGGAWNSGKKFIQPQK